jgi:hypothetical protein
MHEGLLHVNVILQIQGEVDEEVIMGKEGWKVRLLGVSNSSCMITRKITTNHTDKAGPCMAPLLESEGPFRFPIKVGDRNSENTFLNQKWLVWVRLWTGGGAKLQQGLCGKGRKGDVNSPVVAQSSCNNFGFR